jgi:hypothetical protein
MIKCELELLGTVVDAKAKPESIAKLLGEPSESWDDGVEHCLEYRREAFVLRFHWDVASFLGRRTLAFHYLDVELLGDRAVESNSSAGGL